MNALTRPLQIFLGSFVFVYVIFASLEITQVDVWWHLEEGLRMLHTFRLPTEAPAAFGVPAQPYFDEYAGYEVVLTLFYQVTGFPGLWVLFSSIFLLILFLPLRSSGQKYPAFDLLSSASFLFAGVLLKYRLAERPELVGTLLLVLLLMIFRRSQLEAIAPRSYGYLFLLFAVWTNTHSTFIIGFFALFLWMGCEWIAKARKVPLMTLVRPALGLVGAALLGTLINPYGPKRLLFPFLQASDPGSTALSTEMWPIADFHTAIGVLVMIVAGLLVLAVLTSRGMPLWLILFSFFSFYLALRNFRFVSLLVISLLFVVSARDANRKTPEWKWPWPLAFLRNLGFCALSLFMLYAAGFSLLSTYDKARQQKQLATHANIYVPEAVEQARKTEPRPLFLLCGQCEGSYLSFNQDGAFHPLVDSGLAHFTDATKRSFFFILREPEAFQFALDHLKIDHLIINEETVQWLMVLSHSTQWSMVTCSENGMLWRRNPSPLAAGLTAADSQQIETARNLLLRDHEIIRAFCYSTLLPKPLESLDIISGYGGAEWSSSFFGYFETWVDALPQKTVLEFLTTRHETAYPLVHAILAARLGSPAYESFLKKDSALPASSWQCQVAGVRAYLADDRKTEARQLFESISPRPISSVTYYKLWPEIEGAKDPGAYGRWQIWDDAGRGFMSSAIAQLNQRVAELAPSR